MRWLLIRQHLPLLRSSDVEDHPALKIRLVKAWPHPVGRVWLELRVDVLLAINIHETHTALPVIVVLCLELDDDIVGTFFEAFLGELEEALVVVDLIGLLAVDDEVLDLLAGVVEEQIIADIHQLEVGFGDTGVSLLGELHVERVVDGLFFDLFAAALGCFTG
jgi:hypothetical protein